ncbi:hypothetical protein AXG93_1998s1070 [Marchantia polymorpha subsp. ruderalis]|uniref:Uncharacterized protein n=1 Tax=Marchantia polymorpha subsp. ruderalis TaxID=1480154 RepID=A0A176VLV4_MARPO|nr:hypothetical protein AXG93_1998s1070 [Marchantia polymorpha subsp. ruderalis]
MKMANASSGSVTIYAKSGQCCCVHGRPVGIFKRISFGSNMWQGKGSEQVWKREDHDFRVQSSRERIIFFCVLGRFDGLASAFGLHATNFCPFAEPLTSTSHSEEIEWHHQQLG